MHKGQVPNHIALAESKKKLKRRGESWSKKGCKEDSERSSQPVGARQAHHRDMQQPALQDLQQIPNYNDKSHASPVEGNSWCPLGLADEKECTHQANSKRSSKHHMNKTHRQTVSRHIEPILKQLS